jgi:FKBP-type peptidyl-prolyl cis-trans isomerase
MLELPSSLFFNPTPNSIVRLFSRLHHSGGELWREAHDMCYHYMHMARKRDRFFALFGAILFLITASAFTVLVVWTMVSDKNDSNNPATSTTTANKNQLQGTKLANFTPTDKVSKLEIIDQKVGEGATVKANDTVTADYTGAVAATGTIFQSSLDSGSAPTFSLNPKDPNTVIEGWQKGLIGMKVGGTRRLVIPAAQAYAANPPQGSGIPPNAPIVFDITLRAIGS